MPVRAFQACEYSGRRQQYAGIHQDRRQRRQGSSCNDVFAAPSIQHGRDKRHAERRNQGLWASSSSSLSGTIKVPQHIEAVPASLPLRPSRRRAPPQREDSFQGQSPHPRNRVKPRAAFSTRLPIAAWNLGRKRPADFERTVPAPVRIKAIAGFANATRLSSTWKPSRPFFADMEKTG